MKQVDRSPTRLSAVAGSVVGTATALLSGLYSWMALGVASIGLLFVFVGFVRRRRWWVTLGCGALFVGAVLAGLAGAPPEVVLVSVVGAVVAWDVGTTAISLGGQLGRAAPTTRLELVRITVSVGVGGLVSSSGYAVYAVAGGGRPISTMLFLILAVVLLLAAIRRDQSSQPP